MKTKASIVAALLLAAFMGLAHGTEIDADLRDELTIAETNFRRSLVDMVPTKPAGRTLYSDSTPKVYVRFDDGRAGGGTVKAQIAAFLRRGIPVTMALNADLIGSSATYMTWDDIRELQDYADAMASKLGDSNVRLHIAQHGNNNFSGLATMDHGEIAAEMDVSAIVRNTGYRPRVLVMPGDTGIPEFFRSNQPYMQTVADSLGLWYVDSASPANANVQWLNFFPKFVNLDTYNASLLGSAIAPGEWMKPGLNIDRASLYSQTLDLGAFVVERGGSGYPALETSGVIPPAADEWTLAANGANAAGSGIYNQTLAYIYSSALATGHGFAVVMHDSVASDAVDPSITGIAGGELVGQFSPDYVAWTLAMLESKGFVECVGIEEYAEWATGDWAINTDLINNPRCLSPQYAIGDTVATVAEYPLMAGLGGFGARESAQSATASSQAQTLQADQSGNLASYVEHTNNASADTPSYALGDSVTGVRGRKGGIRMQADEANDDPNRLGVIMGGLQPGVDYLFSIDVYVPDGINPTAEEFHLASLLRAYELNTSFEDEFTPAYRDSVFEWSWRDNNVTLNLANDDDDRWGTMQIPLRVPAWPLGETFAGADFGSTTEADAGTLFEPLGEAANEGYITRSQWAWAFLFNSSGDDVILSNPRFIYLGD